MNMMSRRLKETITHWANAGSDGYGGYTWDTPVTMKARWQLTTILFKTPDGEERVSKAVVYVASDVVVGDYLAEGDQTATSDPTTLDDTWEIKQFNRNTNLRTIDTIRKAFM